MCEKIIYSDNNGNNHELDKLLPCPFCGGEPLLEFIGNDFTKNRKVEIKCQSCHIESVNATIRNNSKWVAEISINKWNKRVK